jgi:hypothetical protein
MYNNSIWCAFDVVIQPSFWPSKEIQRENQRASGWQRPNFFTTFRLSMRGEWILKVIFFNNFRLLYVNLDFSHNLCVCLWFYNRSFLFSNFKHTAMPTNSQHQFNILQNETPSLPACIKDSYRQTYIECVHIHFVVYVTNPLHWTEGFKYGIEKKFIL